MLQHNGGMNLKSPSIFSPSFLLLQFASFLCGIVFCYLFLFTQNARPNSAPTHQPSPWFEAVPLTHPLTKFTSADSNFGSFIVRDSSDAEIEGAPTTEAQLPNSAAAAPHPPKPQKCIPPLPPLCTADGFADGDWDYDSTITKVPYLSHEWDKCDVELPAGVITSYIRPELQFVWKPNKCRLAGYSRERFCDLLRGRNILFVGDSITGQHVASFVHLMSDPAQRDNLWIRDSFFRDDAMFVCQDVYPTDPTGEQHNAGVDISTMQPYAGVRVGFRRNNFLTLQLDDQSHLQGEEAMQFRQWSVNQSWIGEIEKHNYEIVVLNTGIWVVDEPIYREMLSAIADHMKKLYPHVIIVWRSTQPGHAFCHTHWARPQKRLYSIADTKGGPSYRWEEADRRNDIARQYFPDSFLDVATQTKLRPDGHLVPKDCLHYCQPGPIDEWNKFLFHHLAWKSPEFLQKIEKHELEQHEKQFE